jgi:ABC-type transporter Mla subunit MlaD
LKKNKTKKLLNIKTNLNKMEAKKMKKEKKQLMKKFKVVIEDLLDNYANYTDEEKAQIKDIFQKVADLNKVLDKYDEEKKSYWEEYCLAVAEYFNVINISC